MSFRITIVLVVSIMATFLSSTLLCADQYNSSIYALSIEPFDYDQTIYNDCNYCHNLHNARRDVSALLNQKIERYGRYIGGNILSEAEGLSVFAEDVSRQCPRSRSKARR
jgi:hypothetical protein